jgi:rfaE bifunctional protein nucleotidyltransferase chain/domain
MKFKQPNFEHKIKEPKVLQEILSSTDNSQIVFTNGCFDILHRGHITYLAQARTLGSKLIVALNSDDSVKRQNKGEDRPINNLNDRMAVIASLQDVDFVTYFEEDTPLNLIILLKPGILVKGGDWSVDKIVGSKEVISWGGKVYSIPFLYSSSTTKIINKIRHE